MKERIQNRIEITIQQLLWILLVQILADLFGVAIYYLLMFVFHGSVHLANLMDFGEYLANGVLILLFWMMMGWFTPRVCRPGLVGGLVTIVIWAGAAFVLHSVVYLPFWSQICMEGTLEATLRAIGLRSGIGVYVFAYALPPTVYCLGQLLRSKWEKAHSEQEADDACQGPKTARA